MKVEINNQSFTLKFGFGFLRKLGEHYNLNGYQEVIELLQKELSSFDQITFSQEDLIGTILFCAASTNGSLTQTQTKALETASIIDFVINQPLVFKEVIEALSKSFPQAQGKPKANPTVRKPTRKK